MSNVVSSFIYLDALARWMEQLGDGWTFSLSLSLSLHRLLHLVAQAF